MQVMKSTLSSFAKNAQAKIHGLRSTSTHHPSSIRGSISSPSNPRLWSTHQPKGYQPTFVRPRPLENMLDTIWEKFPVEVVASGSTLAVEDTTEQSDESFYYSDDSSSESVIFTPSKLPRNSAPMDSRTEAAEKNLVASPGIVDSRPIPMKSLTETPNITSYGPKSSIKASTKLNRKESSANLRQRAIFNKAASIGDVWMDIAVSLERPNETPILSIKPQMITATTWQS
jgi:hypothetical protein